MGLCQGQPVIFNVIAGGSLNPVNAVYASRHTANHVNPENILHTGPHYGAAGFLGQLIQLVGNGRGRGPRIDGLLAGGHHIDSSGHALLKMGIYVRHEAEQGNHGNVGVALVQDRVCVIPYHHAQLCAQPCKITYIHSNHGRIHINCAYNLSSLFIKIAQDILGHLAAAILYHTDFLAIHHDS